MEPAGPLAPWMLMHTRRRVAAGRLHPPLSYLFLVLLPLFCLCNNTSHLLFRHYLIVRPEPRTAVQVVGQVRLDVRW